MLATYRAQGRRFQPDVVVSSWHYTDLDDNVRSGLFRLDGAGVKTSGAAYTPSVGLQARLARIGPYVWISEHSQLWAYVREHGAFEIRKLLAGLRKDKTAGPATEASDQKALSAALLRQFQRETLADGAPFLAVDVPRWSSGYVLESAVPLLDPAVWRDVEMVSPLGDFEAIKASGRKAYFDRGGAMHMTPLANDELAALVARRIVSRGWLKGCASR
jgi:hypothetical protein